jgi:hypothetical protein
MDWIQLQKTEKLQEIMVENATFIQFPVVGSGSNTFTVFGHETSNIKRSIRMLMLLCSEFYLASINLSHPLLTPVKAWSVEEGIPMPEGFLQQMMAISLRSGAEIVVRSNFIEIFGLESAVKMAFDGVTKLTSVKPLIKDNRFQLELASEHREFINGKKMGKVNKITKTTGCRMLFNDVNAYNMAIEIYNPDPNKVVEALIMLEDELPAEISFCVPETYHKRIIGVGGKNIQRIMKKFGVYVKFSSQEEYEELGGYFDAEHNVIARTPAKNANNLESLRLAVVELVDLNKVPTERGDDVTLTVGVSRELQRFYYCCDTIDEVEALKCRVYLQEMEKGGNVWQVRGPQALVTQAKAVLAQQVPEVDMDQVTGADVSGIVSSQEFMNTCSGVKTVWTRVVVDGAVARIIYQHQDADSTKPETDKNNVRNWLREKGLQVEVMVAGVPPYNWEKTIVAKSMPQPINTSEVWSSQMLAPPENNSTTDLFSPTIGFRAAEATASFKSNNSPQSGSTTSSFNYSLFDTSQESAFKNNLGVGSAPDLRFLEMQDYLQASGTGIPPSFSQPALNFMDNPPPGLGQHDPIVASSLQRRMSDTWVR